MVRCNRQTYLATVGVEGFGHDPQLEAIVEEARERSADEVIGLLRPGEDPTEAPRELRALVRAYAGFVESATLQWLQRRTLTREQVEEKGLLKSLFISRDRSQVLSRAKPGSTRSPAIIWVVLNR
jgi:hypothetical protein